MRTFFTLLSVFLTLNITAQSTELGWAHSVGGTHNDYAAAVSSDNAGNVYITGYFRNTVDFDPGPGTTSLTSNGDYDVFITKSDPHGNLVWAVSFGGSGDDRGEDIVVSSTGSLYVTGSFYNTVDFDFGASTDSKTSAGGADIFVVKCDTSGNYTWSVVAGSSGPEIGASIDTDNSDQCYVTGGFSNTVDFDPGAGTQNRTSQGSMSAFMWRLSPAGAYMYAQVFGGAGSTTIGRAVGVTSTGNLVFTGQFNAAADFDPGAGTTTITSNGNYDLFVTCLNSAGGLLWAHGFGAAGNDFGRGIVVEENLSSYTTGAFEQTVDFNPAVGVSNFVTCNGTTEVFALNLTGAGNYSWVRACESSSGLNGGLDIDVDGTDVYVGGYFQDVTDFFPAGGIYNLVPQGTGLDGFLWVLDKSTASFQWAAQFGGSASDEVYGVHVDNWGHSIISGYYQLTADLNPDSQDTLNFTTNGGREAFYLKLCTTTYESIAPSVCGGQYISPGGTVLTNSGTYFDTIANQAGCDSIITINLTLLSSTTYSFDTTVCDSQYVSPGGKVFQYTQVGLHQDTIPNMAGCDSVLTIDLSFALIDTGVTQSGITLTADQGSLDYQWLDCSNFSPVNGETNQSFTPSNNGSYAVMLSYPNTDCHDTSACYAITDISTGEITLVETIRLSPNPTNGTLFVEPSQPGMFTIRVRDVRGRTISTHEINGPKRILLTGEPGIYLLQIQDSYGERAVVKILKE